MKKEQYASSGTATVRGDIQSGATGDKRPGFDPAMAPLETDSEAGGAGLPGVNNRIGRVAERDVANVTYGNAMRRESSLGSVGKLHPSSLPLAAFILVVLGIGAVLLWIALSA